MSESFANSAPRRQSWLDLRFGLRTMLLTVVFAAICVSWWKDRQALEHRLLRMESQLSVIRKGSARSWSVDQVIGAPDVSQPGDDTRAGLRQRKMVNPSG